MTNDNQQDWRHLTMDLDVTGIWEEPTMLNGRSLMFDDAITAPDATVEDGTVRMPLSTLSLVATLTSESDHSLTGDIAAAKDCQRRACAAAHSGAAESVRSAAEGILAARAVSAVADLEDR